MKETNHKTSAEDARDLIHNLLWDVRKAYRSLEQIGFANEEEKGLYWGRVQALENALEKLDAII